MSHARGARRCRDRLEVALVRNGFRRRPRHLHAALSCVGRLAADAADRRRQSGSRLGPLDGEIVTIKDLFDVAGEPTTAGSAMLRDAPAAVADAVVVRRLREAGGIILGKTNMTEFAYSGLGLNPHYGTPRNAVARDRIPGDRRPAPAYPLRSALPISRSVPIPAVGPDPGFAEWRRRLQADCRPRPPRRRVSIVPFARFSRPLGAFGPGVRRR